MNKNAVFRFAWPSLLFLKALICIPLIARFSPTQIILSFQPGRHWTLGRAAKCGNNVVGGCK